jgi:hypothetical protein
VGVGLPVDVAEAVNSCPTFFRPLTETVDEKTGVVDDAMLDAVGETVFDAVARTVTKLPRSPATTV